jgi:hypothetical protein
MPDASMYRDVHTMTLGTTAMSAAARVRLNG